MGVIIIVVGLRLLIAAVIVAAVRPAGAPVDMAALLGRMGERVQAYFARAQSIVFTETVVSESLTPSFLSEGGPARELVYEVRLSWEAGEDGRPPDVKLLRQLLRIDGRAPRAGDEPECADPPPVATEPLVMLLPVHQSDYVFTARGVDAAADRETVVIDFASRAAGPASVEFAGDCVSVSLPGRSRGRIWVDAATGEVLRLDTQLVGAFDFGIPDRLRQRGAPGSMAMERADTSIRYQPIRFSDPEEIVMLPASVRSTTVFRNAPSPRTRMVQTFSNYRRFITGGRLLK